MITLSLESIYYIFVIASIICGAAYKLGYENGKHAKSNCPQPRKLNSYFFAM